MVKHLVKMDCPDTTYPHLSHTWEAIHYFHGRTRMIEALCDGVRQPIEDKPFTVYSVQGYLAVACGTCDAGLYIEDDTLDGPALTKIVDDHYKEKH